LIYLFASPKNNTRTTRPHKRQPGRANTTVNGVLVLVLFLGGFMRREDLSLLLFLFKYFIIHTHHCFIYFYFIQNYNSTAMKPPHLTSRAPTPCPLIPQNTKNEPSSKKIITKVPSTTSPIVLFRPFQAREAKKTLYLLSRGIYVLLF